MKDRPPVEQLFSCPVCGTPNFSARGLRGHCCRSKPGRARLTAAELTTALSSSMGVTTAHGTAEVPATARRMSGAVTNPATALRLCVAPSTGGTCGSEHPSSRPASEPATATTDRRNRSATCGPDIPQGCQYQAGALSPNGPRAGANPEPQCRPGGKLF